MISFQKRIYNFPEPVEIWFFKNAPKFLHTVQDHFLNSEEFWGHLLGGDSFIEKIRSGLSSNFLKIPSQKWTEQEVSLLEEVYEKAFPVLEQGMKFSSELPLYILYQAEVLYEESGETRAESGILCLSRWGFIVVVVGDVVRTTYFRSTHRRESNSLDYSTVFNEAWRYLRDKTSQPQYRDAKGRRTVTYTLVKKHSPANWILPPNPRPASVRRRRGTRFSWLEGLDELS